MKQLKLILLGIFFTSISGFAQEKYTKHTVSKGETISEIAERYNVKPNDIYKNNPDSHKLLKLNQVLRIPVLNTKKANKAKTEIVYTAEKTHHVLAKETMYGIARQYGISVADIEKANLILEKTTLQVGQDILIPVKEGNKANPIVEKEIIKTKPEAVPEKVMPKTEIAVLPQTIDAEVTKTEGIVHEVLPKETKYGIAKRYGITIAAIEKQNPNIVNNLPVGIKLIIRQPNSNNEKIVVASNEKPIIVKNEKTIVVRNEKVNTIDKDSISVRKSYDTSDLAERLIQTASQNIGTRYHTGGTSKEGFDCSGLMCSTFGTFDIKLPRSSFEQSGYGTKINTEDAKKGDLIFFKTNGRSQINHVGMVIEVCNGEIKFIHASVQNGVIISSTKETYYEKNLVQVNRVL